MPIAIDFGTERTKVAYLDVNGPALMQVGRDGAMHIPTIFYVSPEGDRYFGDDASDWLADDPAGIITTLKRKIHEPKIRVNKQRIQPAELIANLFERLRDRAEREIPSFAGRRLDRVVLTMPALYGPSDRELMSTACLNAGFSQVEFIPEPVAAARAWTLTPGNKTETVVVFDCGGGTIDWACLRQQGAEYALVPDFPPGGNTRIGGHDVDRDILDHIADTLDSDAAREDMEGREAYFLVEARKYKERYCNSGALLPFRVGKQKVEFTAERMDALLRGRFIEQATRDVTKYIADIRAGLNTEVTVVLVGGSSRLKGIEEEIKERTGCPIARWDKSDYAVVLGALAPSRVAAATLVASTSSARGEAASSPIQPESTGDSLKKSHRENKGEARDVLKSKELNNELRQQMSDYRHMVLFHDHAARLAWRIADPIQNTFTAIDRMLSAKDSDALKLGVANVLPFTTSRKWPHFTDYCLNVSKKAMGSLDGFVNDISDQFERHSLFFDWQTISLPIREESTRIMESFMSGMLKTKDAFEKATRYWRDTAVPTFVPFEKQLLGQAGPGVVGTVIAGGLGGMFGGFIGAGAAMVTLRALKGGKGQAEVNAMNSVMQQAQENFGKFLEQVEAVFHHEFVDIEAVWGRTIDGIIQHAVNGGADQALLAKALLDEGRADLNKEAARIMNAVLDSMDGDKDANDRKAAVYDSLHRSGILQRGKSRIETEFLPEAPADDGMMRLVEILEKLKENCFDWILSGNISAGKVLNAMRGYARGVAADEILVMHDATVFGGGNNGYLILAEGVWVSDAMCPSWKNIKGTQSLPQQDTSLPAPTGGLVPWASIEDIDLVGTNWMLSCPQANAGGDGGMIFLSLPCGVVAKTGKATVKLLEELVALMKAKAPNGVKAFKTNLPSVEEKAARLLEMISARPK